MASRERCEIASKSGDALLIIGCSPRDLDCQRSLQGVVRLRLGSGSGRLGLWTSLWTLDPRPVRSRPSCAQESDALADNRVVRLSAPRNTTLARESVGLRRVVWSAGRKLRGPNGAKSSGVCGNLREQSRSEPWTGDLGRPARLWLPVQGVHAARQGRRAMGRGEASPVRCLHQPAEAEPEWREGGDLRVESGSSARGPSWFGIPFATRVSSLPGSPGRPSERTLGRCAV